MFDSGISVNDLVKELNTEVDIALDIPNATYVQWLNSLQQLLYTEVIKEQKNAVLSPPFENNLIDMSSISIDDNENQPRFEDIHTVYADDVQLIKTTVASGVIFPNTFFRVTDKCAINTINTPKNVRIVYFVKPALVTVDEEDTINDANVAVPVEFIDLVKAKLRGEAYKLANEDNISAKWLNDYNVLLEAFKVWIGEKKPDFGL
jgi:hypothetical protein